MSTSLYWRPVPDRPEGNYIGGAAIKRALGRDGYGLFDHDGSFSEDWTTIGRKGLLPYLRGVAYGAPDGSNLREEALALIEQLEAHSEIQIAIR